MPWRQVCFWSVRDLLKGDVQVPDEVNIARLWWEDVP